MPAIDDLFKNLRSQGRKAFMPFVTAGDPDLAFTAEVLRTLVENGADLCELGIPYSDPIADGPVIQASYTRALDKGIKLAGIFDMLGQATPRLAAPVVTMVSYAIVYRHGAEAYCDHARQRGVDGLIVPDLPVEEAVSLAEVCRARDLSLVRLITPTTSRERAVRICQTSTGFVYYVSVAGITGERTELPTEVLDNVAWLREQTELPVCIGFGISAPHQVKMLAPVSDGIIVGSAIVRRVSEASTRPRAEVLAEVGQLVRSLRAALDASNP